MLLKNICGIDLGTDMIKIRDRNGKKFMNARNMIALRDQQHVLAIGDMAYEIYEKTPANVEASCPMTNGVIANGRNMELVLDYLMKKYSSVLQQKPEVYLAIPSEITQVEQRAFFQVLSGRIHAKKIFLVEKGIADALSIQMPVAHSLGNMIVNLGADTTEISVISQGKIILNRTLKLGGHKLDEDICTMVRRKFNLHIGQKTAERLKNNLAFMINGPRLEQQVFGLHTLSGLPKADVIPSLAVSVAIVDTIDQIIEAITNILDRTPPQVLASIEHNGIYVTGGVSMILNLPMYMQKELGIPIFHIQDPQNSTVKGLVSVINHKEYRCYARSLSDLT